MVTATATTPELRFCTHGHALVDGNIGYHAGRLRCKTCHKATKHQAIDKPVFLPGRKRGTHLHDEHRPPQPEESPVVSQGWFGVVAPAHLTKAEDIVRHAAREHERIRNVDKTTVAIVFDDTMVCHVGDLIVRVGGEHEPKPTDRREVWLR